jgi:5-methyltetrahydrofolate--homocysteine methyltransferase
MPAAHAVRQDLREVLSRSSAAAVCARTQARHPASRYFTLGRLGADQVADYAKRKSMPLAEIERWLSPNLGYDPAAAPAA